jgi:hypothetical protein
MQITGMGAPTRAIAGKASGQHAAKIDSRQGPALAMLTSQCREEGSEKTKDGVKDGNKGRMNEMGFQRAGKKESGVL